MLPVPAVAALLGLALLAAGLALWRGLPGWWLRGLAASALGLALLNPSWQREEREPLGDIVLAVVDETASQRLGDRPAQTEAALARLAAEVEARPGTELRVARLGDGEGDAGTLLMRALSEALAQEPPGRVAAVVLVTDGRVHDLAAAPSRLPAPLHVLLTGREEDWDRRVVIRNAPAFAILGEEISLTVRVEDLGAAPGAETAPLSIAVDGGEPMVFEVPVGRDMELPLVLPHGGMNVLRFETPEVEGELTPRNNAAVVAINGVRDRLRVLLVSGEPHPGERTWRNLLKSDASVDLVHFTILRPPEKQDGVPVEELSLIAFPTHELFVERLEDFDLVIFDRYRRRGILPNEYLQNVADYVARGGAVLVSAGPEYGGAESVYRSPLGAVLPGMPTARVLEEPFLPRLSPLGERHPVTEGLPAFAPRPMAEDGTPGWGRWFRLVEVEPAPEAQVVMEGPEGRALLLLSRVGEGRAALIASDHPWLWDRGFEGGGPQLEMLRRLAHWLMKEPELEEEALGATAEGGRLRISRRTLSPDGPGPVTVTAPDGTETVVELEQTAPGLWETLTDGAGDGLYRLQEGERMAVAALGPAAPREFEDTIADAEALRPLAETTRGGIARIEDGLPALREVREGRPAAGRGWIGLIPRDAHAVTNMRTAALLPAWAWLLLSALLVVGAWLREGRR
nr:hypothetical protein [Rubellimicrobium sp. CFH 75288]